MLNQARHQAEGQVSAKEDELMRFRLDLSKHQQQVWDGSFVLLVDPFFPPNSSWF